MRLPLTVVLLAAGACARTTPPRAPTPAASAPRALLPIEFEHSAEFGWLQKRVLDSRVLDDMTDAGAWRTSGTATITFPAQPRLGEMRVLRVDM